MKVSDRIALSRPVLVVGRGLVHLRAEHDARPPRPRLAMIAVPLAANIALLADYWWLIPPLVVCAWWWSDPTLRGAWIVAIESGIVGTAWCFVGVYNLGTHPDQRPVVAALWIGYPLVLAGAAVLTRRIGHFVRGYRGH